MRLIAAVPGSRFRGGHMVRAPGSAVSACEERYADASGNPRQMEGPCTRATTIGVLMVRMNESYRDHASGLLLWCMEVGEGGAGGLGKESGRPRGKQKSEGRGGERVRERARQSTSPGVRLAPVGRGRGVATYRQSTR